MSYRLSLTPIAEANLAESKVWYEGKQIGLGEKFIQQVEFYFSRIQSNPKHFPLKKRNFREVYVKKFPFVIIYQIIENDIIVFTVFNTHQNPEQKP